MTDKELDGILNRLDLDRRRKKDLQLVKAKAEMDSIDREYVAYYDGVYDALKAVEVLMAEGGKDNGVTIQQWISVEERLPTEEDADDFGAVLAIHKAARKKYYHWRIVADNPFDFTCWMSIPEGPEVAK